jgi:hypothetical protein
MSVLSAYRTQKVTYAPYMSNLGAAYRNYDYPEPYQGRMVRDQLNTIVESASGLVREIQDTDRMPAWVQYKIATGSDRVVSAADYMRHRIAESPKGATYGDAASDLDRMQDTKKSLTFGMGLLLGAVIAIAALAKSQDLRYGRRV